MTAQFSVSCVLIFLAVLALSTVAFAAATETQPQAPAEEGSLPTAHSVLLWPGQEGPAPGGRSSFRPWMDPYLIETNEPRGAVVVFPGGGYGGRAPHEGAPIARRFNQAGFHAFVVQYRVAPDPHPAPLMDAARALRLVRKRAAEWKVRPHHIAVCGFSAGGHLAASLGVHFEDAEPGVTDAASELSCRPDGLILCYPVISSGEYGHPGSFHNLLGENPPDDKVRYMSLELQVTAKTPPAFLWHTANDEGVPVENSLLFASALSKNKVPFELHVYPDGRHGLGLAPEDPHVATWMDLCCQWLQGRGW